MKLVVALLMTAALFAAVTVAAAGGVGPEAGEADGTRLLLPQPGEVRADRLDDGTPVFVVGNDGDVRVLEAESPISRRRDVQVLVGWCEGAQAFEDAFYATQFDRAGYYAGGPAATGLTPRQATVVDGRVLVGAALPAPAREARSPVPPPARAGWLCDADDAQPDELTDLVRHDGGPAHRPEELVGRTVTAPVVVTGSLERLGPDVLRMCSDRPADPTIGPVCPDDAPSVASAEFEWANLEDYWEMEPGQIVGAYGTYLMTASSGPLRLHAVLPQVFPYGGWVEGTEPAERSGELRVPTPAILGSGVNGVRDGEAPPYVLVEPDGAVHAIYPTEDAAVFGGPVLAEIDGAGIPVPRARLDEVLQAAPLPVTVTIRPRDGAVTRIYEQPGSEP